MKYPSHILIACLISMLFSAQLGAQIYTLNAGSNGSTINGCTGTFYDSGGAGGDYASSENYSITFCSDNGLPLYIELMYDTEDGWDDLFIYDGPSLASAQFGYSPLSGAGFQQVVASGTCLTIQFVSDGIFNYGGWSGVIGCGTPPPPPPGFACASAQPFCSGTAEVFPNSVGIGNAENGPAYGCLGSQPNPAWYFLEVASNGPIDLTISQEDSFNTGLDVDFICWGHSTISLRPAISSPGRILLIAVIPSMRLKNVISPMLRSEKYMWYSSLIFLINPARSISIRLVEVVPLTVPLCFLVMNQAF